MTPMVSPPRGGHQRVPMSTRVRSPLPLLCQQPSRAPTFLGEKPKFPLQSPWLYKTCSCLRPARPPVPFLPSPPRSLPFIHTASATLASLLFLQHTRPTSAPGPLHGWALCLQRPSS